MSFFETGISVEDTVALQHIHTQHIHSTNITIKEEIS